MMSMLGADAYIYMLAGLAALGAVVVAIAPFLGLEPASKQSVVLAVRQPETDERPFWRRKRDFLRQTRNALGRLRSAADGRLPVESLPEPGKRRSKPSPEGAGSPPAAGTGPALPLAREKDSPEAAALSQPEANARPAPQDEDTPDTDAELEQAAPKSPTANLLHAFSEVRAESGDSDTFDEDDEESGGLFGNDSDTKLADPDSLFALFSTDIVEDNEAGKLAAGLDDVDARDLLSEAQQILNEIRDVRRAWHGGRPSP